jgi:hypothetical protein
VLLFVFRFFPFRFVVVWMDDLCMYVKRSVKMFVAFDSRLRAILTNVNVLYVFIGSGYQY